MKKLIVIMVALVLTLGAFAQKRGGGVYYRPRTYVVVGGGAGFGYPYYSPFYNPWRYPGVYGPTYYHRPTKLEMQIADIKSDYSDKIWSARHDTSLSRKERRHEVRRLKIERDHVIMDAKRNYHRK
jgi:hypothetical protein